MCNSVYARKVELCYGLTTIELLLWGAGLCASAWCGLTVTHHELAIRLEAWAFLRLCEHVCLQDFALDVFQLDYVSINLFDHVVNTCQEMFTPFVVSRELLR